MTTQKRRAMGAIQFEQLLRQLGACEDARTWAAGKTLHKVWSTCERGDWLLWLAGKMADKPGWHTHPQVVLAACACAETALKYVPAGEDRPRIAIEVARRWAAGGAGIAEVRDAADAACYACNSAAAAYAAYATAATAANACYAYACYACYGAAAATATDAYATATDAYATDAAATATATDAYATDAAAYATDAAATARTTALKELADIVRRELPEPMKAQ